MVVPLQPQRVVEDAEHLERFAEVGRAVARDAGQHLHHIAAVLLDRQAFVAVAEVDNRIDHAPAVCVRVLPHGEQTRTDDPTVVKREVGDKAQLMDVVFCLDVRPLRLGKNVGLLFDRPHQDNLFKRLHLRLLGLAKQLKAAGHALFGREPQSRKFRGELLREIPAQVMVGAVFNKIFVQFTVHMKSPDSLSIMPLYHTFPVLSRV